MYADFARKKTKMGGNPLETTQGSKTKEKRLFAPLLGVLWPHDKVKRSSRHPGMSYAALTIPRKKQRTRNLFGFSTHENVVLLFSH